MVDTIHAHVQCISGGHMKPTNINLEDTTRRDLKRLAKRMTKEEGRKVTAAELVRIAVKEYLRGRV